MRLRPAIVFLTLLTAITAAPQATGAQERWAVCGRWREVATPETYAYPNDIAVVSPSEAWFAGYVGDVRGMPVVMHWTGMRWERTAFPAPEGTIDEEVAGLEVISAKDVWAVGSWRTRRRSGPLAAHWDGRRWRLVKVDVPHPIGGLSAITRLADTKSLLAVGSTGGPVQWGDPSSGTALVLLWNGRAWQRIAFPRVGAASQLKDVAATGQAVWAVGSYESQGGVVRTLAARMHVRDRRWKVFTGRRGSLQAVGASSATRVWAVGPGKDVGPQRGFVMRWDGEGWKTARRFGWGTGLQDVVVASSTDAWAVGYRGGIYAQPRPLLLRRHGSSWRWARPPATQGRFFAVDGTTNNLWALSWQVHDTGGGPPLLATFHRC